MRTLRRLSGLVTPLWRRIALSIGLGAMTVAAGAGLLATGAYLIASAAFQPPLAQLQMAIVGVRFFGISRGVLRYAERLLSHDVTFRSLARLRTWFLERLEPLAPGGLSRRHSGDLLARIIADVETLDQLFIRGLAPPLVAVVVATAAAAFLAAHDPLLGGAHLMVFAAAGALLPAAAARLARGLGPALRASRARLDHTSVETLQGMADLIAAGSTEAALGRLDRDGRESTRLSRRLASRAALHEAAVELVSWGGVWVLLLLAVPMVREGRFDGVGLAVLLLAGLAAFEAVEPLPAAGQHLEEQRRAADRVFDVVDAEPTAREPSAPISLSPEGPQPALQAWGLRFTYPGAAAPAVAGVDLTLASGSSMAVVGPSGAGKSTLAGLILGFWHGFEGELELWGTPIRRTAEAEIRRNVAVVPQRTRLFTGTVRDNLLLADPHADAEAIRHAVESAGLAAEVDAMPRGLDTWIGAQGLALSGGQRQRLGIARAILRNAPLLILDEPTANLDPSTEQRILDTLHGRTLSRTTLAMTHRLVAMDRWDAVVVMSAGRIVEHGTHDELVRADGLYAHLHRIQSNALDI